MATNRLSSGCAEYCGRSPLASDRPKLRPAGEPAGPELHQWFFLESDTEFADEHLLLALAVGDDDALAVVVLDTGSDECNRVPDQVDEGSPQLLVNRGDLARP